MLKQKELKQILPQLPLRSYSLRGKPNEPVSILVIGSKKTIEKFLSEHGWYKAVGINPITALAAGVAAIFNSSYLSGPISPSFINHRKQQLGFQRPTRSNTFRRRHHLRLWRTGFSLDGHRLWVGTLSYDRSTGFYKRSIFPTHHISASLSSEENFLAGSLGLDKPVYLRLAEPEVGTISNGDPYDWDGKALIIDLSNET